MLAMAPTANEDEAEAEEEPEAAAARVERARFAAFVEQLMTSLQQGGRSITVRNGHVSIEANLIGRGMRRWMWIMITLG